MTKKLFIFAVAGTLITTLFKRSTVVLPLKHPHPRLEATTKAYTAQKGR